MQQPSLRERQYAFKEFQTSKCSTIYFKGTWKIYSKIKLYSFIDEYLSWYHYESHFLKSGKNYSANGFASAISMNLNKSCDTIKFVLLLAQSEDVWT